MVSEHQSWKEPGTRLHLHSPSLTLGLISKGIIRDSLMTLLMVVGSRASKRSISVPDPCSFRVLDCSTNVSGIRFLKNHFPVNLSRSKSQEVSNIFWQMFYNQKYLRKIWVNTVFWLFCWELFSRRDTISAVIISTCQWRLESLDPHFSCNLTSNQSKCLYKQCAWFPW
jgi:hypothetical protein